jgi:hypothetical protein
MQYIEYKKYICMYKVNFEYKNIKNFQCIAEKKGEATGYRTQDLLLAAR